MSKIIIAIFLVFAVARGFADEKKPASPSLPKPPTEPVKPVVPGAVEKIKYPRFPSPPRFPNSANQSNGPVQEIEKYDLIISGAFPNGDSKNNVADTIRNAHYILYSNRTVAVKLFFKDGAEYVYHLRNPRSKIQISAEVFRETFDTTVQVGKEFLLEQYLSELYYDNNSVTSLNLIGANRIIVLLIFSKKA